MFHINSSEVNTLLKLVTHVINNIEEYGDVISPYGDEVRLRRLAEAFDSFIQAEENWADDVQMSDTNIILGTE